MLYPFMTMDDGTEIVYSEIIKIDDKDNVRIEFERWNDVRDAFDSMECLLPDGKMSKVIGFSQEEANYYQEKMIALQNMIIECSREDTESEYASGNYYVLIKPEVAGKV